MIPARRAHALLGGEFRLQWRYAVLPALGGTGVSWAAVLLVLPPTWRPGALPWLLFLEVAAVGFFFLPALAVVERGNGVTATLRLTRLHPSTALAVRVGVLVAATVVTSLVLATIARVDPGPVAAGAALTTLLLSLVAVVTIGRADDLTTLVARAPLVATPLLIPALLDRSGAVSSPWLALSPATGAFRLLADAGSIPSLLVTGGWCLGLWVVSVRIGFDVDSARAPTGRRPDAGASVAARGTRGWLGPARSFAAVDRRTLLHDRLLLILLAGVPLIALAVRWLTGSGAAWIEGRYGIDLAPHLPAVWAFVLVLHVPVVVGALTGLLFLEDRDAGLFAAIAVTPASLRTLVGYRVVATVVLAAVAVAVGVLLSGAQHAAGATGIAATAVAGAAVATVPAILMATLPRDRAQGMALMKVITLPLYLPVAWWYLEGPAGWLFAPIPTAWAARTFWAATPVASILDASVTVAVSALVLAVLGRRLLGSGSS